MLSLTYCYECIPPSTTTFQAFGDADAATTGTARRGRPPTPPVLRIGPTINDISLQRLGKSCPVVKAHFDAAADRAYDAIKPAVTDVTSETARYLIDRPKNRSKTAQKLRKNRGNSNAHHTAKEDVDENCTVFVQVMDVGIGSYSASKKENLFWLPDDPRPIPADAPSDMAISPWTEAVKYPVFRIKYEAVKTRLNKDPKGNTSANKAIRWKDMDDGAVKTKRKISSPTRKSYKGGRDPTFKRKENGYVYRLCYLEVDKILSGDEDKQEEQEE